MGPTEINFSEYLPAGTQGGDILMNEKDYQELQAKLEREYVPGIAESRSKDYFAAPVKSA